jgi:hypothetical protein
MDQIGGVLQQYAGGAAGANADADFDAVAQHAPHGDMASAIAGALQSNETPPIAQIVSQVFGSASGAQKAGILNTLLSAAGPAIIQQVLQRFNLGNLAGMLGNGQVDPQQAEQFPAEAVGQIAEQAHQENPNIMNELSGFLSGNPALLKSLGGPALSAVMSRLGR